MPTQRPVLTACLLCSDPVGTRLGVIGRGSERHDDEGSDGAGDRPTRKHPFGWHLCVDRALAIIDRHAEGGVTVLCDWHHRALRVAVHDTAPACCVPAGTRRCYIELPPRFEHPSPSASPDANRGSSLKYDWYRANAPTSGPSRCARYLSPSANGSMGRGRRASSWPSTRTARVC